MKTIDKSEYWNGNKNKMIRYYFYMQRGLALLNEFRYLIMAIFALYIMFKLDNPVLLIVMFLVAVPILVALGYLCVHHIAKVIEYLNIQYATYWSKYSIGLQEKQLKLLEDIKNEIHST